MRNIITSIGILFCLTIHGQEVHKMIPTLGHLVERSTQGEVDFEKQVKKCEEFWLAHRDHLNEDELSIEEKKLYELCATDVEGYWDIIGVGCSWYCGGGQDTISASSHLIAEKEVKYLSKNIHDLNYQTAWIEGVSGYGIKETITYHFPPQTPRITEIIVVNGYVKSEQLWKNNSRVKKLKMYVDDKLIGILSLADSRQEQHFKVEPLGYGDRSNWEQLQQKPWWTITFEILEVYKGDKYDNTAITEIYFDGIDVH